jgi:tetratricopeptide (TPR) repeat protein
MQKLSYQEVYGILTDAATFRGLGNFQEALKIIKINLKNIPKEFLLNALLEMGYCYEQMGDMRNVKKICGDLRKIDPNIPFVKKHS